MSNETVYSQVYRNIAQMKLIQLGITLSDHKGSIKGTWQFNFNFNLKIDKSEPEAINILKRAGIDFERLSDEGI